MTAAALERDLDTAQHAAVVAPVTASLALLGFAGTGKTVALVRRARRLTAAMPGRAILLTAPSDTGVARLHRASGLPSESLGAVAFAILRDARPNDAIDEIDDVRASQHFERAGAALFALDWTEFVSAEIDPEITGLRAPERFSAAAFRLIRKLRASLISPAEFKAYGLRGAAEFYGKPPNLASSDLLMETSAKYRDSLRVTPEELERQRSREVDLVLILSRLYASYVETLVANGCLTPVDAVYEATLLLRQRADVRDRARERFAAALVDDAQDLTAGGVALLAAIFGDDFSGVTFAGDLAQSTLDFAGGGRGAAAFSHVATTIAFQTRHRGQSAIERVARRAIDPTWLDPGHAEGDARGCVETYRAESVRDEARYVGSEIARLIGEGVAPERIAVVTRSLGCAHAYVDALIARDIPVDVAGSASIYAYPAALDALAALWSVVDPFRHDYLLRNLEAPWLRLADASIAILCNEATSPQPLLFELPGDDGDETRSSRWDERRNVRLGRNVTRGDVDDRLTPDALARLIAFRETRMRWESAARTSSLGAVARIVLEESSLATLESNARGRFDGHLIARVLEDIDAFAIRDPLATLEVFLRHAEDVAASEADLLSIRLRDALAVRILDVEVAKGEEFDAVFIVDAKAGAWPRYYVPDAFLFTPKQGMIPKDNVGDALAARTAKFTYVLSRLKMRENYNKQERRAFACAATRARSRLFVSAAGRATRGISAPELLVEIEKTTR